MLTRSRNDQIKRLCRWTHLLRKFTVMNWQDKIHYTTKFEDTTVGTFYEQFADRTNNTKITNAGTCCTYNSGGITVSTQFSALNSFTSMLLWWGASWADISWKGEWWLPPILNPRLLVIGFTCSYAKGRQMYLKQQIPDCQITKYMKVGAFCNLQAEIFEFCIKSRNSKLLIRVILKRSDRVETLFLESSNFPRTS